MTTTKRIVPVITIGHTCEPDIHTTQKKKYEKILKKYSKKNKFSSVQMEFLKAEQNHLFNGPVLHDPAQFLLANENLPPPEEHFIYSVDPGIDSGAHVVVKFTVTENDSIPSIEKIANTKLVRDKETPKELFKNKGSQIISTLAKRIDFASGTDFVNFFYQHDKDHSHVIIEDNTNKWTKDIPAILVTLASTTVEASKMKPIHTFKPKNIWSSMKRDCGWQTGDKVTRAKKKAMTRAYVNQIFRLEKDYTDDVNDALLNALFFAKKKNYFSTRTRRYVKRK